MCWCDEYEITINRADELMLHKLDEDIWFVLDPETIRNMITFVTAMNRPSMKLEKSTYRYKNNKDITTTIELRLVE